MDKRPIQSVEDLLRDSTIRAVGVVADKNQGKTNTLNHCIKALQTLTHCKIFSFGLRVQFPGVTEINSINELESISNSVVIIDEFIELFSLNNARQKEKFQKTMQKINHSNNIFIICGLPENFNKYLSAMLQAIIFKQCTLTSFIQRSPMEQAIKSYNAPYGSAVQKGSYMLTMPKNTALIHDTATQNWWTVGVPYVKDGDAKQFNPPVLEWKDSEKAEKDLDKRIKALEGA